MNKLINIINSAICAIERLLYKQPKEANVSNETMEITCGPNPFFKHLEEHRKMIERSKWF